MSNNFNLQSISKFESAPEFVLEQVVLHVEGVLHLVELLAATDHVGDHDFGLGPGQVFVDALVVLF